MSSIVDTFYEDCMDDKSIAIFSWNGKPINEMTDEHIQNCINMLKEKNDNRYDGCIDIFEQELVERKSWEQDI